MKELLGAFRAKYSLLDGQVIFKLLSYSRIIITTQNKSYLSCLLN